MVSERDVYRLLNMLNWYKAAARGPGALVRRALRIYGYRTVNRMIGYSRPRRRRR
jgi:hypothetical protein